MRQVARAMPLNSMKRSESRRGTTRDDAGDSQDLDRLFERQIFCHQTSVSRGISVSICAGLIQSVSRAFAKIGSRASNHPPTRVCPQRLTFLPPPHPSTDTRESNEEKIDVFEDA